MTRAVCGAGTGMLSVILFRLRRVLEIGGRRQWRVVRRAGWAHSSGLWAAFAHPEVAIFGLPADRWGLVNVVAELVSAGTRLCPGVEFDDVLVGSRVAVRRIDPSWCLRLFGPGGPPEVVQIVWPDADGGFPWELGGGGFELPRLWLPVDDHLPLSVSWRGCAVAGGWRG